MPTTRTAIAALITLTGLAGLTGCSSAPDASLTTLDGPPAARYDGFGHYHRPASTTSPDAQAWFDQGMQLLYGFNHDEAIRSFHQAAQADPDFAMAWWGIAYAHGLHINNPAMTEVQSKRAYAASRKALDRIDHASPVERALINAVAQRYSRTVPDDRRHLDEAYAEAMQRVWAEFPGDADVGALFAESLMNLQPWDLWTPEGQPKGRTPEIVATLERVLTIDPNHPGANHFYIHTVEASPNPERALPAADRLAALVPGSGHLVHMPAHIYARVGDWGRASDANVAAVAADRAYFEVAPPPEFYSLYYVHNLHFLAWSAMMEGRYEASTRAARDLQREIPEPFLREWTFIADGFMPVVYHTMIRFGKWEQILAEPEPPEYRLVSRALHHYARGIALANTGRPHRAHAELAEFESIAASIPDTWMVGNNTADHIMKIARCMLTGEIAYHEGREEEAFDALRRGIALEDELKYDEPPGWMQPVRHALGALLMAEGRPAEAEQVYRDDLAKNPDNGWSLLGLQQALGARGYGADAEQLAPRLDAVWARADVKPVASCYCHPDAR